MLLRKASESGLHPQSVATSLQTELKKVSEKYTCCELWQKECEFLRKYGKPKEIADAYHPSEKIYQAMPFVIAGELYEVARLLLEVDRLIRP